MKEEINLNKFQKNLENESDRGVALISAEIINNCLTSIFEKYLILNKKLRGDILENPMAPLYSLSNKIKMAYSLGLISKRIYKNLEYIRIIRNKFAHRIYVASFEDAEIIEWCKKIKIKRISVDEPSKYRYLLYDATYYLVGYLQGTTASIKKRETIGEFK